MARADGALGDWLFDALAWSALPWRQRARRVRDGRLARRRVGAPLLRGHTALAARVRLPRGARAVRGRPTTGSRRASSATTTRTSSASSPPTGSIPPTRTRARRRRTRPGTRAWSSSTGSSGRSRTRCGSGCTSAPPASRRPAGPSGGTDRAVRPGRDPARRARSSVRRASLPWRASTISPSTVATPRPSRAAASRASTTLPARSTSSAVGANTRLTTATWAGWMQVLPSKPSARARRALRSRPASSRYSK